MNTLVACIKSYLNDDVSNLIRHYTDIDAVVNPVGGWNTGGYDRQYPWSSFLNARTFVPAFKERYSQKRYVEVGYTTIPFVQDAHHTWKKVGVINHPLLWIKEAYSQKYFTTSGDSTSFKPSTLIDYAKMWNTMTYTIVTTCKPVFRIESVFSAPTTFLQQFDEDVDTSEHPPSEPLLLHDLIHGFAEVWPHVEELATQIGYTDFGLLPDFKQGSSITRSVVCDISPVSVIIAARNYGAFLKDAIQSTLRQSIRPLEIIYSDDASTDDSVQIARSFPTVKVLTSDHQQGVCEARNKACKIAKGKYLLHLDGDDIFPYQYIEHKINVLKDAPDADFVFSAAQAFGNDWNTYWDTPNWDATHLWNGNYVNTSTLYRRSSFMKAGMWRETIGTGWDWDLALRMAASGRKGVRDPWGFLLYRHHPSSVSQGQQLLDKTSEAEVDRFKYLMRNVHCQTQISCVLSGRVLDLFPKWMDALARNVTFFEEKIAREKVYNDFGKIDPRRPNLTFLHTGPSKQRSYIHSVIEEYSDFFENISVRASRWENQYVDEAERRDNVARFMANSCNTLMQTNDQLIWFVEDDVIPPDLAMYRLNMAVLGAPIPLFAAAGVYRNRHDPAHLVAHDWEDLDDLGTITNYTDDLEHDTMFDVTGTGCLMIFRPFARHNFESHIRNVPAHDWNWCMRLRENQGHYLPLPRVLLLKDVQCRHYLDENNHV